LSILLHPTIISKPTDITPILAPLVEIRVRSSIEFSPKIPSIIASKVPESAVVAERCGADVGAVCEEVFIWLFLGEIGMEF
jgi:hypothetical protein